MDAKLKSVLKGDPEKKKKRDDRLKTETGEELLYAEFAPGLSLSLLLSLSLSLAIPRAL